MSSPGFEPSPYGTAVSVANHYTVRATSCIFNSRTGEYFPPLQFTCRNCGGGDRGRVAIYRPFVEVSLSLNRTVTCMVLKASDRRTSCPCHDEFRGPRSDYVRQNKASINLILVEVHWHAPGPKGSLSRVTSGSSGSSSSLDHGSKLRGPSPNTLV
ncbi:uncharacterized protein TNCV_3416061 [Trichonephila clavipes]|nr:uncharacterized protein TNCV_3416061 [Trichonephila clavipes]